MKKAITSINIFFSWQSDLPKTKTTEIIDKAINGLKKKYDNKIDITVDKDMRNTVGMLDISNVILSKIENSDIFIADLSIVNEYKNKSDKAKHMSNPNVLFELGYAAAIVGWDRVASVANIDYGDIDEQPFDINHRSIIKFSLKKGEKQAVSLIQATIDKYIKDIVKNGKRPKNDSTFYEIGTFDFKLNEFEKKIKLLDINARMDKYKNEILYSINQIIHDIKNIKIIRFDKIEVPKDIAFSVSSDLKKISDYFSQIKPNIQPILIKIEEETKELIRNYCISNNISIEDDFFYLGELKYKPQIHIADTSSQYIGSEKEIKKYELLLKLEEKILYFNEVIAFYDCFYNIHFLPIAIKNVSKLFDENITTLIEIDDMDLVNPKDIFSEEKILSFQNLITDIDFMNNIFELEKNNYIDTNYDNWPIIIPQYKINGLKEYTIDDLYNILKWYFASPNINSYKFEIKFMNLNDIIWIGPIILFEGDLSKFNISVEIRGKNYKGIQYINLDEINQKI